MVYAPHALPMYREDKFATTSKMKRKERADPVKSKRPDLGPIAAAQKGLAFPGMQTSRSFAQHLFKESVGPSGMDYLNQDPREALLKCVPPSVSLRFLQCVRVRRVCVCVVSVACCGLWFVLVFIFVCGHALCHARLRFGFQFHESILQFCFWN